ncbi:MAG: hypothetical protein U5N53_14765 [Mycobacterium sp.]|nr:hypothetical protein [Mycobacterium sp.]
MDAVPEAPAEAAIVPAVETIEETQVADTTGACRDLGPAEVVDPTSVTDPPTIPVTVAKLAAGDAADNAAESEASGS